MNNAILRLAFVPILALLFFMAACNSNEIVDNGYKTLKSSEEFYASARGAMQEALNSGAMDKETALKINTYAEIYKDAFFVAKVALQGYKEAVDIKNEKDMAIREELLKAAMRDLVTKLDTFKDAIMPYILKKTEVANG